MAESINRKELLEGPIISSLLKLAIPLVLANILQSAYQLIDAFWVGRLGGDAVAAVSVTTPVVFLFIALGFGLAIAGSTLIAQYVGAGNFSMVNHVAAQTTLMVMLVSLLLASIGYFFTPNLLHLIGVAPEVYRGAVGFMRVTFMGLPFNFFFIVFQSFMRSTGHAKVPVYIVSGTVVLNFLLDPLFIFGWGPIPAMGVMGAALATFITQVIAALIGLLLLFRGRYGIHLKRKNFAPDWAYIKRAFLLGFPASIEQSMRGLGLIVMTFLITSFGTLTLAAYGVGSSVLQVVMIPAMGLSMAISTLVGQNIGAGNIERAAKIGSLGTTLGFWVLTGFGILAFLLAPHLIRFFVPEDPNVIAAGAEFLRTMSWAWGFIAIQFCLTGVFRASGNMFLSMIIALVSQWVLQFPLAYVLSRHSPLGTQGLWWAFPVTNLITALITWVIFRKGDWKKKRLTDEDEVLTRQIAGEIIAEEGIRQ
ncbi:MATE family efflux transporter [Flavisolibacter tropicus]|uniref:Transporter n=1 Tax=Flavisolibacter tropicus TaxID=1492898 RepID=A0A172TYC0_9BACT|nr:MATE family efflux transporter [Flavisolibacter tropicus]ANE52006.1 transporter [Flavisolibacter tropicus]